LKCVINLASKSVISLNGDFERVWKLNDLYSSPNIVRVIK